MKVYLVLVIFIFSSCNILKTLTGGETKVDDEFFQNFDEPEHGYIFIGSSNGLQIIRTSDNTVFSDTNITSVDQITPAGNKIYFAAYNGSETRIYRQNDINENLAIDDVKDPDTMTSFRGDLYAVAYDLLAADTQPVFITNDSTSVSSIGGSHNAASNYWFFGDDTTDKLINCYENSGGSIYTVNPASGLWSLVTSGSGCASSPSAFYHSGYVFWTSGNFYFQYDIAADELTQSSDLGASLSGIKISHQENFYFQDGSRLFYVDVFDSTLSQTTIVASGYGPSNTAILESPDKIYFTNKDTAGANVDQLYEFDKDSLEINQITEFTTEKNIRFVAAAGTGFYLISDDGIELLSFDDQSLTSIGNLLGGSILDIKFYREKDINI